MSLLLLLPAKLPKCSKYHYTGKSIANGIIEGIAYNLLSTNRMVQREKHRCEMWMVMGVTDLTSLNNFDTMQ